MYCTYESDLNLHSVVLLYSIFFKMSRLFLKIFFAPKFPVTYYTELRYLTGYEVTKTMVDVRYILNDKGMRYDIYSPAKRIQAHILLPKNKKCKTLLIDGN